MHQIKASRWLKGLWRNITVLATLIGLMVDLIALTQFVGIVKQPAPSTPSSRPNTSFVIWMSAAVLYSLGFINSFIYRGWLQSWEYYDLYRNLLYQRHRESGRGSGIWKSLSFLESSMTRHRAFLAALTSLPAAIVYAYLLDSGSYIGAVGPVGIDQLLGYTAITETVLIVLVILTARGFDVVIGSFSEYSAQ